MSSSIPNAIQAFMSIATAALPSDTQVFFGKTLPQYVAPVNLQVSGTINGRQSVATFSPDLTREEQYEFDCTLVTWAGDNDYLQRMLDAFANFKLLTVAIANNPQLATTDFPQGVVRFTQITQLGFTPEAAPDGASTGTLAFNVNCQQRIASLT